MGPVTGDRSSMQMLDLGQKGHRKHWGNMVISENTAELLFSWWGDLPSGAQVEFRTY